MTKHNASNERIKRKYRAWMKSARGKTEATIDAANAAIYRFEAYTRFRDFKAFHIEQAIAFRQHLNEERKQEHG